MSADKEPAALPPELAALANEAAALEAEQAPPASAPEAGQGGAPIEAVDYGKDVRALVTILSDAAGAFWPSTKAVLTKENRDMLAAGWTPVAEQYGFSLVAFLAKYGVWIGAGFATSQIAIPFAEAVRHDRAAAAAAKAAKAPAPPPAAPTAATTAAPPASDLHAKV